MMLPRERLIEYGVESLSVADLLAIIIGSGSKEENVFQIAEKIASRNDLYDLLDLTFEELLQIKGIKTAKACKIISAIELSKRIFNYKKPDSGVFKDAKTIFHFLKSHYLGKKKEEFVVMYLDNSFNLIKKRVISTGEADNVYFNVGDAMKYAFKYNSELMVLAHNHPSGNPKPSANDKALTRSFEKQAKLFNLVLLDHIIVTSDSYYSFATEEIGH